VVSDAWGSCVPNVRIEDATFARDASLSTQPPPRGSHSGLEASWLGGIGMVQRLSTRTSFLQDPITAFWRNIGEGSNATGGCGKRGKIRGGRAIALW
jgi:hypothetical protein